MKNQRDYFTAKFNVLYASYKQFREDVKIKGKTPSKLDASYLEELKVRVKEIDDLLKENRDRDDANPLRPTKGLLCPQIDKLLAANRWYEFKLFLIEEEIAEAAYRERIS
jgi:hypothetical protein